MSESSLREAIARAARWSLDAYYAQPNDGMQLAEEDAIADDVLAVLADHDAQVRAEALREAAEGLLSGVWPEDDEPGVKNAAREIHYRADRIERGEQA